MIPHINVRRFDGGAQPALAIHCTLAHAGAWKGLARAMADTWRISAMDLPNHGKSGDWNGEGDLHDAATAMARTVLNDLGPSPVDLIGHSFGATVALRLAVEVPERVRRAIFFEPVFFAPAMADTPAFAADYAEDMAEFEAAMAAGDAETAARAFNRKWGDGSPWAAIPEPTRQYMIHRIGFVRASTPFVAHDSAGLLEDGRLQRASMPVLLMRGALSPRAAEVNRAIARRLSNVTEAVIPDSGHMAPISDPELVAQSIRPWLAAN